MQFTTEVLRYYFVSHNNGITGKQDKQIKAALRYFSL